MPITRTTFDNRGLSQNYSDTLRQIVSRVDALLNGSPSAIHEENRAIMDEIINLYFQTCEIRTRFLDFQSIIEDINQLLNMIAMAQVQYSFRRDATNENTERERIMTMIYENQNRNHVNSHTNYNQQHDNEQRRRNIQPVLSTSPSDINVSPPPTPPVLRRVPATNGRARTPPEPPQPNTGRGQARNCKTYKNRKRNKKTRTCGRSATTKTSMKYRTRNAVPA